MRLSDRVLNRTLWVRQHLVADHRDPAVAAPLAMTAHLLGLQAQDNLPPYLSLAARIDGFDPRSLSGAIDAREVVRILTMRGTVHVLTPADALALRPWLQESLDRGAASIAGTRAARDVPSADLLAAARDALSGGPLGLDALGEQLARAFPAVPADALRAAARARLPLVQVPPRGLWRRSGGVVYELLTTWLDAPETGIDLPALVRRYLRAFGPASPADMTKWSGVTRLGPVFAALADDLVEHTDERGRRLFDLADAPLADADLDLPPLLLGTYDNLWLAHAERRRIATDENRQRWMGPNGGTGAVLFVDGMIEGIWRRDGDDVIVAPMRRFTKAEQRGVDAEIARIRAFLRIDA